MKTPRISALLLLYAVLPAAMQAQTFTAAKIEFDHPGTYSQTQLESVAGMHAGTKFTVDDLSAAAQRLADTGYFSDVSATTAPGRVSAITVQFNIKPLERSQMLRLTFENFVWLMQDEIKNALEAKAPLYQGYVPADEQMLGRFNDALTEALAQKGVMAKVMHDAYEPSLQRPEIDVDYWVVNPSVRIANVKLTGVLTDLAPLIQESIDSVGGKVYSAGLPGGKTSEQILAPLLNAGYIDAALSDVSITHRDG